MSILDPDTATPSSRHHKHLIAIGLVQGLILYGLWIIYALDDIPIIGAAFYNGLLTTTLLLPLCVYWTEDLTFGRFRKTQLVLSALIAGLLGAYQAATAFPILAGNRIPLIGPQHIAAIAIALFISVPMLSGLSNARATQRVLGIWDYTRLFDDAWRNAVLSAQAILLTLFFWSILEIGAQLFALLGYEWIREEILHHPGVAISLTTTSLAAGIRAGLHRADFTKSLRNHWLTITAWMLVISSVIGIFFILTAFSGLDTLFKSGVSAFFLLWFIAFWIKFYNCAFQTGDTVNGLFGPILRRALAYATLAMLIMSTLAGYALYLRIEQYGLTPDRIWGSLVAIVGFIYSAGYATSALKRSDSAWLSNLPATNIIVAMFVFIAIILMLSPALDPRRISVSNQLSRLHDGTITTDKLDLSLLAQTGKFGHTELVRLSTGDDKFLATRATDKLASIRNRDLAAGNESIDIADNLIARMDVHPHDAELSDTLLEAIRNNHSNLSRWEQIDSCLSDTTDKKCQVLIVDMDSNGTLEAIVWPRGLYVAGQLYQQTNGTWKIAGHVHSNQIINEDEILESLTNGNIITKKRAWHDLILGSSYFNIFSTPENTD